jgi:prepilin-type N-terminal cleavage/methylation domain-containing protein/prepilin-type processing-associated H-X9-DG protein
MSCLPRRRPQTGSPRAFTLIEILVVVAIIALLISILLPSLARARTQARIAMCKANSKQLATVTATYQSEFQGAVPILFNYGAEELNVNDPPTKFAANSMLAVALRRYERGIRNLLTMTASDGTFFDPNTIWLSAKRSEFETKLMPGHYACPFETSKGKAVPVDEGTRAIKGIPYKFTRLTGRIHAYSTWQWEGRQVRGQIVPGEQYPTDPGPGTPGVFDGRPKFSVLSWCMRREADSKYPIAAPAGFYMSGSPNGSMTNVNSAVMTHHRKWTPANARAQSASSLSDVTVLFCMQGQFMGYKSQIYNEGSHGTAIGGGTNAAFADSHVEWIKGTQLGWP